MKRITVLGSTGSVGVSTLNVLREHPEKFWAYALAGGSNSGLMIEQCAEFKPLYASMSDDDAADVVRDALRQRGVQTIVIGGKNAAIELASLDEVDVVVAAIVGTAGLLPTMAAIKMRKRVLLANKEALVTCGPIFMDAVQDAGADLIPIDSEHNAIFQCMPLEVQQRRGRADLHAHGVTKIVLTGSGGPFLRAPLESLKQVTPEQACAHPNWSMGRKISVDSATMMNKGLEYIEARWLFNASDLQMQVLVHPQSIIHSMVHYRDGSFLAQLGTPDMRTPIAYGLGYPQRINANVSEMDFSDHQLVFTKPDPGRFPCLFLAMDCFKEGQGAMTALNAANEVAVEAFLERQIGFQDITTVILETVERSLTTASPTSIGAVVALDEEARGVAASLVAARRR